MLQFPLENVRCVCEGPPTTDETIKAQEPHITHGRSGCSAPPPCPAQPDTADCPKYLLPPPPPPGPSQQGTLWSSAGYNNRRRSRLSAERSIVSTATLRATTERHTCSGYIYIYMYVCPQDPPRKGTLRENPPHAAHTKKNRKKHRLLLRLSRLHIDPETNTPQSVVFCLCRPKVASLVPRLAS